MVAKMEKIPPLGQKKIPGVFWDTGGRCNAGILNGSAHSLMGNCVEFGANGYLLLSTLFLIDAYFKFQC